MNQKNMTWFVSIFLVIGLFFSVNCMSDKNTQDYNELHQVYLTRISVKCESMTTSKAVRRLDTVFGFMILSAAGILCAEWTKWYPLKCPKTEVLYFLKQIRVSQRMDGKKRTEKSYRNRKTKEE